MCLDSTACEGLTDGYAFMRSFLCLRCVDDGKETTLLDCGSPAGTLRRLLFVSPHFRVKDALFTTCSDAKLPCGAETPPASLFAPVRPLLNTPGGADTADKQAAKQQPVDTQVKTSAKREKNLVDEARGEGACKLEETCPVASSQGTNAVSKEEETVPSGSPTVSKDAPGPTQENSKAAATNPLSPGARLSAPPNTPVVGLQAAAAAAAAAEAADVAEASANAVQMPVAWPAATSALTSGSLVGGTPSRLENEGAVALPTSSAATPAGCVVGASAAALENFGEENPVSDAAAGGNVEHAQGLKQKLLFPVFIPAPPAPPPLPVKDASLAGTKNGLKPKSSCVDNDMKQASLHEDSRETILLKASLSGGSSALPIDNTNDAKEASTVTAEKIFLSSGVSSLPGKDGPLDTAVDPSLSPALRKCLPENGTSTSCQVSLPSASSPALVEKSLKAVYRKEHENLHTAHACAQDENASTGHLSSRVLAGGRAFLNDALHVSSMPSHSVAGDNAAAVCDEKALLVSPLATRIGVVAGCPSSANGEKGSGAPSVSVGGKVAGLAKRRRKGSAHPDTTSGPSHALTRECPTCSRKHNGQFGNGNFCGLSCSKTAGAKARWGAGATARKAAAQARGQKLAGTSLRRASSARGGALKRARGAPIGAPRKRRTAGVPAAAAAAVTQLAKSPASDVRCDLGPQGAYGVGRGITVEISEHEEAYSSCGEGDTGGGRLFGLPPKKKPRVGMVDDVVTKGGASWNIECIGRGVAGETIGFFCFADRMWYVAYVCEYQVDSDLHSVQYFAREQGLKTCWMDLRRLDVRFPFEENLTGTPIAWSTQRI